MRPTPRSASAVGGLLGAILLLSLPRAALAQASPAEQRRDNQRLAERVRELEAELAESRRQLEALRNELDALRRTAPRPPGARPAGGPATAPAPAPGPASTATPDPTADVADPADRFSGPAAMQAWLARDYSEKLAGLPRATDDERRRYIEEVRRWVTLAALERRPVEWTVRLLSRSGPAGREIDAQFVIIDPASGEPVSAPLTLTLGGREARRILDAPLGSPWVLRGVFGADPHFDPDRTDQTPASHPDAIGPWARFGWSFAVSDLRPAPPAPAPAPAPRR